MPCEPFVKSFAGAALLLLTACGGGGGDAPVTSQAGFIVDPFTDTAGRTEVACPAQTINTVVIFAFGQSNSANQLETKYTSTTVLNYFNGKCYLAQDPLLGATDNMGSLWTELGNRLTQFDQVILIPRGIGGTSIQQWVDNDWLDRYMQTPYTITHFLWVQGEADNGKSADQYAANLRTIIYRTKTRFTDSAFYVAIATICKDAADLNIEQAQRSVIGNGVFQGANLDLYGIDARYDGCHLSASAQAQAIDQWASLLH